MTTTEREAKAEANRRQAEDAYAATHLECLTLADQIEGVLSDLPAPDVTAIDWSHVGSLQEVRRQLRDTLAFLKGEQR